MKTTTFKVLLIISGLTYLGFACQDSQQSSSTNNKEATVITAEKLPHDSPAVPADTHVNIQVDNELVCMVNDVFMGRKQFPVPVGDKVYYGCCEMCVDKLKNSDQYRFAIDPLTKEKVDKVDAYIVLKSRETGAVLYFKSKENYEKYMSRS